MFDLPPSPVPQDEVRTPVVDVQLVNAFWQFLPAKSTTFWRRTFFREYPRPIFKGNTPPYPVQLPVISLVVPKNQAFALKRFSFAIYEQSPVGVGQFRQVDPSETVSYFAFEVKVGNRTPYDSLTNVSARGDLINYNPPQGTLSVPPSPGNGMIYPFSGVNNPVGENFAAYAQSGDKVEMKVWLLREPQLDIKMMSASAEGYNLNQVAMDTILSRITK